MKYIGHILSGKGISVDPAKTDGRNPRYLNRLIHFWCIELLQKIIEGYSQRSAPFRELISKDKHFVWGPEQDRAFAELKSALTTAPILQYPDTIARFS